MAPMTVFPLAKLPEELVLKVLSYITDTRDLCQIALASKQLHHIAAIYLYRSVSINASHFLAGFVLLIHQRPELARFVRDLTFINPMTDHDKTPIDEALIRPIMSLVSDHEVEIVSDNGFLLSDVKEQLEVLLLRLLPNLENLGFRVPEQPGKHYNSLMHCMSSKSGKLLPKLKFVNLEMFNRTDRVSFDEPAHWLSFFHLPCLQRVKLRFPPQSGEFDNTTPDPPDLSAELVQRHILEANQRRLLNLDLLSPVEDLYLVFDSEKSLWACDVINMCGSLKNFGLQTEEITNSLHSAILKALSTFHGEPLEKLFLAEVEFPFPGGEIDYSGLSGLRDLILCSHALLPVGYEAEQIVHIVSKMPCNLHNLILNIALPLLEADADFLCDLLAHLPRKYDTFTLYTATPPNPGIGACHDRIFQSAKNTVTTFIINDRVWTCDPKLLEPVQNDHLGRWAHVKFRNWEPLVDKTENGQCWWGGFQNYPYDL